jgi:iron(III) transport system substrate-binding protein
MTVVGLLAGCGGSSKASTPPSGASGGPGTPLTGQTITLYNGQHPQTTQALVAAFERQTGIRVKERDDSEAGLVQAIEQEGSSSPADVIYTENSPALMTLEEKGVLSAADPAALAETPAKYNSPEGDWVGVSARVSVLVYNTDRFKADQLPTSALDLAKPEWKGKLALAPTETDLQPIVISIAKAKGTAAAVAWLKAIKSNASSHIEPDNETLVADVNSGQAGIGLVNNYYWFRLVRELGQAKIHSAEATLAPQDPGYVLNVSGAGVLKSSKHQAAAQAFIKFLASTAGETALANSDSYEYPLGSGVAAAPALKPFAQLQPVGLSIAELGDGSEALQLLQQAQLI